MPNPITEERSLIDGLRDTLKLDRSYTDVDVVELAKIVSTSKLNPKALLLECASITATDDAAIDRAGQLCVDGHAEYDAEEHQKRVKSLLAKGYQHGSAELGLPPDRIKANKLDNQIPSPKNHSEKWHKNTLWHTRGRLWWVRFYRLLDFLGAGFLSKGPAGSVASTGVSALGLSYFAEGFVDLYTLGRLFFYPTDEEKAATPNGWERVRNMAAKGSRPTRLWNFRWGIGNLLDFVVTLAFTATPVTAAIKAINDLVWFLSDVVEEAINGYRESRKCNRRLKLLERKIQSIEQMLLVPGRGDDVELIKELAIWQRYHARALEHKAVEMAKCWRAFRVTFFLAAGMAILLIPQMLPIMVAASPFIHVMGSFTGKMIGGGIALFFGSMYGGLGRAMWNEWHPEARDNMLGYMWRKITGHHPLQNPVQSQPLSPEQTVTQQPTDNLSPDPASEIELQTTLNRLRYEKLTQARGKNALHETDSGMESYSPIGRVGLHAIKSTASTTARLLTLPSLKSCHSEPVLAQPDAVPPKLPLMQTRSAPAMLPVGRRVVNLLSSPSSPSPSSPVSPRKGTIAARSSLVFSSAGKLTVNIPQTVFSNTEAKSPLKSSMKSPMHGMDFPISTETPHFASETPRLVVGRA